MVQTNARRSSFYSSTVCRASHVLRPQKAALASEAAARLRRFDVLTTRVELSVCECACVPTYLLGCLVGGVGAPSVASRHLRVKVSLIEYTM